MFPETWQLLLALLAACLIGVSKTGIAGLGILVAALFANLMPAKLSSGFVLPMLILGDLVAVFHYRRHADWRQVLRLFPWTIPGLLLGFFTFGRIDDHQARVLIGGILALMVAWHLLRKWFALRSASFAAAQRAVATNADAQAPVADPAKASAVPASSGLLQVSLLGVSAGFTTLIANAAGPLMNLYLLAMRMPKLEFVGTAAVFFCALNLVKVPLMVSLGSINAQSLLWNLTLAPAVLLGTWLGRLLLKRIPQQVFEYSALALSAAAAVRMLVG
jgi:uncharacterized membrane protein YfcA